MFARKRTRPRSPTLPKRSLPPLTTMSASFYFGLAGGLYILTAPVVYFTWLQDHRDKALVPLPGVIFALLVGIAWVIGSQRLWRRERAGLIWVAIPLLAISLQWFGSTTPTLTQFWIWLVSIVALLVSWRELRPPSAGGSSAGPPARLTSTHNERD
jgi:hypothetical protein